ncbi:ATP-binding protein [Parabacteroides sp. OttesenSCG-928-G07]|nr:ATP-binding protein [Parabacteroides sp. OttesenSCG-928-G07]
MDTEFKLIALRPLDGCAEHILKCLSIGYTYYFSNDYIVSQDDKVEPAQTNLQPLSSGFFSNKGSANTPLVNISAIVGKNGDGKSSVIEIIMRLINNFAIQYNLKTDNFSMHKVNDVRAALYYKIGSDFYCLKEDKQIEITCNGKKMEEAEIRRSFFYSMISNYSHYAYNIYDFKQEWNKEINNKDDNNKCWLFKVFHKNDGYQTPLVLHPYRDKGNIDINTEKFLSDQRLMSLFFNAESPKQNPSSFRNINNRQYADLLLLKDFGYSKLQERTIAEYFKEIQEKSVLDAIINSVEEISKSLTGFDEEEKNKEIKSTGIKNLDIINERCIIPLNNLWNKSIKPNLPFFKLIIDKLPNKSDNLSNGNTDLSRLLRALSTLSSNLTTNNQLDKIIGNTINEEWIYIQNQIKKIIDIYSENKFYLLNILQIQRIDLVDHVCDLWKGLTKDERIKKIKFELTNSDVFKDYKELSLLEKSYHYIVYKTISIFEKYPNYNDPCSNFNKLALAFESKKSLQDATNAITKGFEILLDDLTKEKTHITLKLRQALCFNNRIKSGKNEFYKKTETETSNNFGESNFIRLKENLVSAEELQISNHKTDNSEYILLSFDALRKYYNDNFIDLEQLPPPIFQSNIYLKQFTGENRYTPITSLSSGEKQMLNSTSAVIYHLQNINSVSESQELIKYKYVNLILEEIELYFHPDYQRSFIKSLLKLIDNSNLNRINGINIIFVTHSPFILSDIPKRNVLFLKEGKPTYEMQENTFGANIHSLLKNGFFLDTLPIGDFAHEKINSIFFKLNSGDFSDEEFEQLYQDIILVGEPYIRGQLLSLYNSYKLPRTDFDKNKIYMKKFSEMENQIKKLNNRLNNGGK